MPEQPRAPRTAGRRQQLPELQRALLEAAEAAHYMSTGVNGHPNPNTSFMDCQQPSCVQWRDMGWAEAAASVPAPEQDEAVRAIEQALRDRHVAYRALHGDFQRSGHAEEYDECSGCVPVRVAFAALATPPPVPAAPLDMEMHHVLDAIADDEDGGPEW